MWSTGSPTAGNRPGSYGGLARAVRALRAPAAGPFLALLLVIAFFALESDRFLLAGNASLILQQAMVVGVLAVGQTLVILTAGIDLSNGAVMALGQIVMAKMATQGGAPPLVAMGLGLTTCAAFGLLNGVLVTRIRLPPFIVTLGTLNIAFALTHIYSNDESFAGLPASLTFLGRTFAVGSTEATYGVVCMLGVFGLTWYALTQTAWGRHVYATGDDPVAARLSGIRTDRVLLGVYVLAGLAYGVAAVLLVARTEVGDPNAGFTDNLDSITAVVLGGTSLFGGRGSVLGTLVGVLIVGVFRNGLTLIGVDAIYQILTTGVLVILAVSVDHLTQARPR